MIKKIILFLSLSCLLVNFINHASAKGKKNSAPARVNIISPEPFFITDIPFYDKKNNKIYFDKQEDKLLLVVFWASWCGSCVDLMLSLDNLAKDFAKIKQFKILAISEDYKGIKAVDEFYKKHNIRFLEQYHDYQNEVFQTISISGLPTALIVKGDKVVKILKGEVKWYDDDIRTLLLSYIDNNPVLPKNSFKQKSLN